MSPESSLDLEAIAAKATHHRQPTVELGPQTQETEVQEKDLVDKLNWIFSKAHLVTHRSSSRGGIERPISTRANRAELYNQVKSLDRHDPEQRQQIEGLLQEGHRRDEVLQQFLNRGKVSVDMGKLGTQTAQYTIVNPEITDQYPNQAGVPTTVLLGTISGPLETSRNFTEELALHGQRVITISYPESGQGEVTEAFAQAVVSDPDVGPHAEFYQKIIEEMTKQGLIPENFNLWGYSTGATIAAKILNNPELSERVQDAALICPAGTTRQSGDQQRNGFFHEIKQFMTEFSSLPQYQLVQPRKNENNKTKGKVFSGLSAKIRQPLNIFENARVQEGGKIKIMLEEQDTLTDSARAQVNFPLGAEIIRHPDFHVTPLVEADTTIETLLA